MVYVLGYGMRFIAIGAWLFVCCWGCKNAPKQQQEQAVALTYTREELLNPETCAGCHTKHFEDWQASVHAQSTDELFLAFQSRARREVGESLGTFCVNCHAPMAVRDQKTTDGNNLAELPAYYKGVTCYYCHSVESVAGTHNNPLILAQGANALLMHGPLKDPIPNSAHRSTYSALFDSQSLKSSSMCGSCHDIQNQQGLLVEQTFQEWKESVYADVHNGSTCNQCHMPVDSNGLMSIAIQSKAPQRLRHSHLFPGVDVPLDSNAPGYARLRKAVEDSLQITVQQGLCVLVSGDKAQIRVVLDNVGAGHFWTSGATSDRRAWVEVVASAQNEVIYQSGVFPGTNTNLEELSKTDPDLWVMRECLFENDGRNVPFFWQGSRAEKNTLPALTTLNQDDPAFYKTHYKQSYPRDLTQFLPKMPDRVTLRVRLQMIGTDLLQNLINSNDLSPTALARVPTYDVTRLMTWTMAEAKPTFTENGLLAYCVADPFMKISISNTRAVSNPSCKP
jgi:hypothetical protein